jgi:hypothetical protein
VTSSLDFSAEESATFAEGEVEGEGEPSGTVCKVDLEGESLEGDRIGCV